ncbi:MAG: helix-turn-helix transcriptional regulator, partial [Clostridia bacterium]|nr:helix-turn-helix transcriptional regulator [Clostridia bacterium]
MELYLAERLRKYRKEKELTQEALAQVIGVSPQSISKWECGDGYPDITLLPGIANYF